MKTSGDRTPLATFLITLAHSENRTPHSKLGKRNNKLCGYSAGGFGPTPISPFDLRASESQCEACKGKDRTMGGFGTKPNTSKANKTTKRTTKNTHTQPNKPPKSHKFRSCSLDSFRTRTFLCYIFTFTLLNGLMGFFKRSSTARPPPSALFEAPKEGLQQLRPAPSMATRQRSHILGQLDDAKGLSGGEGWRVCPTEPRV